MDVSAEVSQKIKMEVPCKSAIRLLGIELKDLYPT